MPIEEKKINEFAWALDFLGKFSKGEKPNVEWFERPDFIVNMDGKKIGMEVTRLMDEESAKKESHWKEICIKIKSELSARGFEGLSINILQRKNCLPKGEEKSVIVNSIIKKIEKQHSKDKIKVDYFEDLNKYVTKILLHKTNTPELFVSQSTGGYVKEECSKIIQEKIFLKNDKLRDYKKHDEMWLLLVADNFKESGFFEPSDKDLNVVYKSMFDRVFYFNHFEHKYC